MSCIYPKYTWLATGGKNRCRWSELSVYGVLIKKKIMLYPDLGCYEDWSKKAKTLKDNGFMIKVSDILEKHATEVERKEGLNLADYLILRDKKQD